MSALFEGLAEVLSWLYSFTHSYGLSIILLTLAVRVVVTPLTIKGTRSMMSMQKFQPEIKRLQQEHKGDRQKLNEEMMRFYRENNINPMGSCLPLLIQIPVFIILYRVVHGITRFGTDGTFNPQYLAHDSALYRSLDGSKRMLFLGLDLAKSAAGTLRTDSVLRALPYLFIIAIVTATSYIQQRQVAGRNPGADINPMQKNLMRIMPLSFAVFSFSFPAALGLYFVTSNLYQVGQQWYISRALYGIGKAGRPGAAVIDVEGVEGGAKSPAAGKAPSSNGPAGPGSTGTGTTKPPAGAGRGSKSPGATPRRGSAEARGGVTGGNRNAAGKSQSPKARPTSGRVTEPKRTPNGQGPSRGFPSSGAAGGRLTPRPGGQPPSRRRTPFGTPPTGDTTGDPQKKRRR
jgi:YidC/Oxa1 family membrane protein insertase